MRQTVASALDAGLRIGAHPSYPDRENFGRQSMTLTPDALCAAITEQVCALQAVVNEQGGKLSFVKPHGALYNDMVREAELTSLIIETIKRIDPKLKIMGLAGSHCRAISEGLGMQFLGERAIGALDVFFGRVTRYAKCGVGIGHGVLANCYAMRMQARVVSCRTYWR